MVCGNPAVVLLKLNWQGQAEVVRQRQAKVFRTRHNLLPHSALARVGTQARCRAHSSGDGSVVGTRRKRESQHSSIEHELQPHGHSVDVNIILSLRWPRRF